MSDITKRNGLVLSTITVIIMEIGQAMNRLSANKFPLFTSYQITLMVIRVLAYYSIYYVEQIRGKFRSALVLGNMNFEKKRLSSINFLYPTVASVAAVADIAALIRDIQLDWYVRLIVAQHCLRLYLFA